MAKRIAKPKKPLPVLPSEPPPVDPIRVALDKAQSDSETAAPSITCAADLIPFVQIPSPVPGKGLIPLEPWPFIFDVLKYWDINKSTCMLKDRQMGISWLCALDCLYDLGWKSFQNICSLNYEKDQAAELIWRMQILWSSLPKTWRPAIHFTLDEARAENGSRAYCVATKDTAAAGDTIHKLVVDEAGLIKNLDKIWPSLMPAVQHGKVQVFSTPRQAKRFFKVLCDQSKSGANGFKYMRLEYRVHPDRIPGTPKGDAWYAAELKRLNNDKAKFAREYGGQFEQEGDCYFGTSITQALRARIDRLKAMPMNANGLLYFPPKLLWGDKLRIYRPYNSAHRYITSADVAEGLADGDYSAACVLDCNSGEEVAAYHGHINPTDYAVDLEQLARMYGMAWIAVEANNHGHAVTQWLFRALKYRRLFREKIESKIGGPTSRLGLSTNVATRPTMLSGLEYALRVGAVVTYDLETIEELESFVSNGDGTYSAGSGSHDDRVLKLAIAQAARSRPIPTSW